MVTVGDGAVPRPRTPARRRAGTLALAGLLLTVLGTGTTARMIPRRSTADLTVQAGAGNMSRAATSLSQALLAATPSTRLGLGALRLDGDFGRVIDALGPPDATVPDIDGSAHRWRLPGGELDVTVRDGTTEITALQATVDPGGPPGVTLFGGLQLGKATLGELLDVWGEPAQPPASADDDFVAAYTACAGAFPVVIKFDQTGPGRGPAASRSEPLTRVLVAYADEPATSAGCFAP